MCADFCDFVWACCVWLWVSKIDLLAENNIGIQGRKYFVFAKYLKFQNATQTLSLD